MFRYTTVPNFRYYTPHYALINTGIGTYVLRSNTTSGGGIDRGIKLQRSPTNPKPQEESGMNTSYHMSKARNMHTSKYIDREAYELEILL